jgi:hypothetical protein
MAYAIITVTADYCLKVLSHYLGLNLSLDPDHPQAIRCIQPNFSTGEEW